MFPSILIVDDEPSILQSLGGLLSDEGFDIHTAGNGYEALKRIESDVPDLVLLDIWMPGIDGIETLQEIKKHSPSTQVIIITGHGTIETAVKSTKLGAFDLIEKPLSIDKIIVSINNALNFRRLEEENRYLRKKMIEKSAICGNSPAIQALKKQVAVVAPTEAWILLTGENGTGKELVARTVHQLSARADNPMLDVNCAAIPEALIDSELFGHEKDAFRGATKKARGKFELADGGTIFFDEIGDMSLKTQAKILRVLEEQKFQRLGSNRVLNVNVRVIAASNKDLEKEIERGCFREDLYYRLNVIPIELPPLRERREDIPLLVEEFLKEAIKQNRSPQKVMSAEAIKALCTYAWPGNVRELKNLIERLVIMVPGDQINISDIPPPYRSDPAKPDADEISDLFAIDNLERAKRAFENEYITRKLEQYRQDVAKTATALGVSSHYLNHRIKHLTGMAE